jgi:hypothetical protein
MTLVDTAKEDPVRIHLSPVGTVGFEVCSHSHMWVSSEVVVGFHHNVLEGQTMYAEPPSDSGCSPDEPWERLVFRPNGGCPYRAAPSVPEIGVLTAFMQSILLLSAQECPSSYSNIVLKPVALDPLYPFHCMVAYGWTLRLQVETRCGIIPLHCEKERVGQECVNVTD